jgi:hypothetical protein
MIPSSIQCLAQCGSNCPVFARLAVLPLLFADHTSGIRTGLRDYRAKPDAVPLTLQNRKTYRAPFVFAKVRLFLCNVTAQVIAIPALKRYPACTPSSSSVLPRVCMYTAPRIYLPDLPARVSDLVGVLTGTKCLPRRSVIHSIAASQSRGAEQGPSHSSAQLYHGGPVDVIMSINQP